MRTKAMRQIRTLVAHLQESARAVETRTGVTNAQLYTLRQLAHDGPMSVSQLTDRMLAKQSAVSLVARRLVDRGLVRRMAVPRDARRVCLAITRAGRTLIAHAPDPPAARLSAAFDALSANEVRALGRALQPLLDYLGARSAEPPFMFEPPAGRRRTTRH